MSSSYVVSSRKRRGGFAPNSIYLLADEIFLYSSRLFAPTLTDLTTSSSLGRTKVSLDNLPSRVKKRVRIPDELWVVTRDNKGLEAHQALVLFFLDTGTGTRFREVFRWAVQENLPVRVAGELVPLSKLAPFVPFSISHRSHKPTLFDQCSEGALVEVMG